ncbi:MAG: hypothetical protein HY816_20735 [Candidatus Wallbacteria bacterium]|nr:hypothetical protein [Candidatus Wallbacteria bacterium]
MTGKSFASLLGACNAVLLLAGTLPARHEVTGLREKEREALEARQTARRSRVQAAAAASVSSQAIASSIALAELHLARRPDLPALTAKLRRLATTAGLALERVEYRSRHEWGRAYADLEADLLAQGTYRALKALLWGVEHADTAFTVRSIAVLDTDRPGSASRTVRLTLGTYLVP